MAKSWVKSIGLCGLMLLLPAWLYAAPRVVSLSPANTELAFAAGITPVGVSAFSDYPSAAKNITQIADWQGINSERILALHPDVVLAWRGGNPARPVAQLQALGLKVIWIDPERIEDIIGALRDLAPYSPEPQRAQQAADELEQRWNKLLTRYASTPRRKVFLQFGSSPLFTSSQHTLQNEIVSRCGGDNIFNDSRVPWPQVSREQVLARKPQAIIYPGNEQKSSQIQTFWAGQLTVPLIGIKDDWFARPGPRIILAAEQICSELEKISKG
ncbi:vitamin B12-binding protein [Salmonella enterica subsp. enterica serovar Choleraesuis]|nr:vitamin B12-binding protein [Salmonella enterica subsp. enterica serovar Choleraesuis]